MPIREHKCRDCGFQFETIDFGSDSCQQPAGTACPKCGSKDLARRISLFSSPNSGASSSDTSPAAGGLG
ncbi:MAG TPA: zinc ribbon domain-containing protein [bacterium]|nr:zinc ribbon domain-containing protein [bacterium]